MTLPPEASAKAEALMTQINDTTTLDEQLQAKAEKLLGPDWRQILIVIIEGFSVQEARRVAVAAALGAPYGGADLSNVAKTLMHGSDSGRIVEKIKAWDAAKGPDETMVTTFTSEEVNKFKTTADALSLIGEVSRDIRLLRLGHAPKEGLNTLLNMEDRLTRALGLLERHGQVEVVMDETSRQAGDDPEEEFTQVSPDDPTEADMRDDEEAVLGDHNLAPHFDAIAAEVVKLVPLLDPKILSAAQLDQMEANFKRQSDQLEQIPQELFDLIAQCRLLKAKAISLQLLLDQARHTLANQAMKCSYCDGSGQDDDGEAHINAPCPKCKDVRTALTNIDGVRQLTLHDEDGFGDLYDLKQWEELRGVCTPDDGSGYWSTRTHRSRIDCFMPRPEWATHVMWYNK
jgi:phage FluMu protein Com